MLHLYVLTVIVYEALVVWNSIYITFIVITQSLLNK